MIKWKLKIYEERNEYIKFNKQLRNKVKWSFILRKLCGIIFIRTSEKKVTCISPISLLSTFHIFGCLILTNIVDIWVAGFIN